MEPTLATIMLFAGNFAPRGWALCEGQLLPISQNQALFSLLGTIYGGDGRTTFALPDLRGRTPIQQGRGPGLSSYREGQKGGVEHVILNTTQIPAHTHGFTNPKYNEFFTDDNSTADPSATKYFYVDDTTLPFTNNTSKLSTLGTEGVVTNKNGQILNNGGGMDHTNQQPYLALNYIICIQGLFPSRS